MFYLVSYRTFKTIKIHPERITKADKNMVNNRDYEAIKFPVSKKDYCKIEQKNNICINIFCYENDLIYPVYVSHQKFKNLLIIANSNKSHYVYINDINIFMSIKQRTITKNTSPNVGYNLLVVKKFL